MRDLSMLQNMFIQTVNIYTDIHLRSIYFKAVYNESLGQIFRYTLPQFNETVWLRFFLQCRLLVFYSFSFLLSFSFFCIHRFTPVYRRPMLCNHTATIRLHKTFMFQALKMTMNFPRHTRTQTHTYTRYRKKVVTKDKDKQADIRIRPRFLLFKIWCRVCLCVLARPRQS